MIFLFFLIIHLLSYSNFHVTIFLVKSLGKEMKRGGAKGHAALSSGPSLRVHLLYTGAPEGSSRHLTRAGHRRDTAGVLGARAARLRFAGEAAGSCRLSRWSAFAARRNPRWRCAAEAASSGRWLMPSVAPRLLAPWRDPSSRLVTSRAGPPTRACRAVWGCSHVTLSTVTAHA